MAIFGITPKKKRTGASVLRVRALPGAPQRGLLTCGPLVVPCALGRSGLTRMKREGDGATPVGRFALLAGFRRTDRTLPVAAPFALVPVRRDDGWCDDPTDGRYNRPVRLPFAPSHEVMTRDDRLYDLVIVLDVNIRSRRLGRGSAVFFHLARPDFGPTAGCVAIAPDAMRRLLPRLSHDAVMVIG